MMFVLCMAGCGGNNSSVNKPTNNQGLPQTTELKTETIKMPTGKTVKIVYR